MDDLNVHTWSIQALVNLSKIHFSPYPSYRRSMSGKYVCLSSVQNFSRDYKILSLYWTDIQQFRHRLCGILYHYTYKRICSFTISMQQREELKNSQLEYHNPAKINSCHLHKRPVQVLSSNFYLDSFWTN